MWPWLTPSTTASIGCGACHDNGPFICSPYLNQINGSTEPNVLPGSDDTSFNSNQPYAFVGDDFASWKAFKVEVGNECTTCHRLGVNNVPAPGFHCSPGTCGTALDFAERATSATEISEVDKRDAHKTKTIPISVFSPIWMPFPGQYSFSQAHYDHAKAIHDCAAQVHFDPTSHLPDRKLPDSASCRITPFAAAYVPPPSELDLTSIYYLILDGQVPSLMVQQGNYDDLMHKQP